MLVPTFLNNNDYPDDISELPYGYETYIRCFPKLKEVTGMLPELKL